MTITNHSDIPLALAVWALHDDYDYVKEENYISATQLMKPLRQLILSKRVPKDLIKEDVEDYVSRALGTSLHASIEKVWTDHYELPLKKLGYPQEVIDSVLINPTEKQLADNPDCIPVYLEQREMRQLGKYKVGGKYDIVLEGILHDTKSTSAYSWVYGNRAEDFITQGSIYRWLNPKKITADIVKICFIFTDWQKAQANSNPNYPQKRFEQQDYPLKSEQEIEKWMERKIALIEQYKDAPDEKIPECTPEELWMSAPKFKYYADPAKISGRSTKNFDDISQAHAHKAKAGKGIIITEQALPKRCGYCSAAPICKQRQRLFND